MNRKTQLIERREDLLIDALRKIKGWRILLIPGALLIWCIGWFMVWASDR